MCHHVDKKLCVCNESKSMWIKCSESMPEEANDVLIFIPGWCSNDIVVAYLIDKSWRASKCCKCPDWKLEQVTRWMPLPSDPKD